MVALVSLCMCMYVRMCIRVCVYACVFARRVSERERACISSEESKKEKRREGVRWKERKDEGEFVRVSETRRVFIRRDGEWRRG